MTKRKAESQTEPVAFDARAFMRTEFSDRTEDINVPDLAEFFGGKKDAAVWVVRGLSGAELARVNEAVTLASNLESVIQAVTSDARRDKVEALRAVIGLNGDDVPQDLVKRIEMLCIASVEPAVERDVVVRLADAYPIEFFTLTNAITRLTGMGKEPGKPNGSGATPASEPH